MADRLLDPYPEHRKLDALKGANRVVGEFLEWVAAHPRLCLGQWMTHDDRGELVNPRLIPASVQPARIVAEYFGIDEAKLETEKRAMLRKLRELEGGADA